MVQKQEQIAMLSESDVVEIFHIADDFRIFSKTVKKIIEDGKSTKTSKAVSPTLK